MSTYFTDFITYSLCFYISKKNPKIGLNAKTWTLFSTYSWIKLSQLTPIFFRYLSGDK